MPSLIQSIALLSASLPAQPWSTSQPELLPGDIIPPGAVVAELRAPRTNLPVGSEVVVEFILHNRTDEPVRMIVPGALVGKERLDFGMGLPLEHVFSAQSFRALDIHCESRPQMSERVVRRPEYPVPPVTIAPFATVGLRFDVARFYPGLHQPGTYRLVWRPYGGLLESEPLTIHVVQYKQVVMETEFGSVTIQLLYDKAPRHVANFLDLVDKRFYNNKVFHSVYQNQFILGGCPEGTGVGKRPDGACIAAEFNDTPFEAGTVGMALLAGDPNSGSCQFFISLSRQPQWDGRYTAFGQVTGPESLAVLQKLGGVAVDKDHRPTKPLAIKSMIATDAPFLGRSTQ